MRSVLMGTDFLKDIDGSIRMIETNTNIILGVNPYQYIDISGFTNFVLSGGYTEIDFIYNEINIQVLLNYDELEPPFDFVTEMNSFLRSFCKNHNITYVPYKVGKTAITIPYIEDSVDKLIIRVAYDSTALIDDTYARDNWEFLKLMHDADPDSIIRTYINDPDLGFDTLGTTLRDNGVHPNYCVKKRFTPADTNIYPKVYRLTLMGELNSLKQNLEIDEYIQEYVINTNDTLNNKYKHYRSVDMIYGPNLDIYNMWVLEQTNPVDIIESPDYAQDLQIQKWERGRYLSKFHNNSPKPGFKLSADDTTNIIKPDGTTIPITQIQVGDIVKSIDFSEIDPNMLEKDVIYWSGRTELMLTDYTISTAQLMHIDMLEYVGIIRGLYTANGSQFSDVGHADIFRDGVESGDTVTRLVEYEHLSVGDKILLFDTQTSTVIEDTIVNIDFSFQVFNAYTVDFETLDLFLTLEETPDRDRYGIVTHNYTYDCIFAGCNTGIYSPNPTTFISARGCLFGSYYIHNCLMTYGCVRTDQLSWDQCDYSNGGCSYWGNSVFFTNTYCNSNKPSDIKFKENIKLVSKSNSGLNIYQYNYIGDNNLYEGVIAQELLNTIFENAITKHPDGLYVDYSKIDVKFKKIN